VSPEVAFEQHVLGFHVPVHQLGRMDVRQGTSHVQEGRKPMRQREARIVLGAPDASTVDALEHQTENTPTRVLHQSVALDQRRVAQPREHARLSPHPLDLGGPHLVRIDQLQRAVDARIHGVVGPPDAPLPSGTQALDEQVAAHPLACVESHGF